MSNLLKNLYILITTHIIALVVGLLTGVAATILGGVWFYTEIQSLDAKDKTETPTE